MLIATVDLWAAAAVSSLAPEKVLGSPAETVTRYVWKTASLYYQIGNVSAETVVMNDSRIRPLLKEEDGVVILVLVLGRKFWWVRWERLVESERHYPR